MMNLDQIYNCLDGEERNKMHIKLSDARKALRKLSDDEIYLMLRGNNIYAAGNDEINKLSIDVANLVEQWREGNWFRS